MISHQSKNRATALGFGKLATIEIDPHPDEVGQGIGHKVDFALSGVDQRHVDMFEVFGRGVMDDWRWKHNLDLEFNSLDAQRETCEAYIKSYTSQRSAIPE